jgi:antitoxin component of RelBE/YafQ-DinJ toxin-antitoxin module
MVLKTFNVEQETYKDFSEFCKSHGISMSKQVQMFMQSVVDEKAKDRQEHSDKLERIKSLKH